MNVFCSLCLIYSTIFMGFVFLEHANLIEMTNFYLGCFINQPPKKLLLVPKLKCENIFYKSILFSIVSTECFYPQLAIIKTNRTCTKRTHITYVAMLLSMISPLLLLLPFHAYKLYKHLRNLVFFNVLYFLTSSIKVVS